MIDFSFLIYDAPLWFIFWVWTKVLLSDSPGNVEKNSYAYLQSLGYYQANVHLLHMHFLVLSLPQNSSSGRGCKNKHQNFASWHNMGQIMDSLWTVQKNWWTWPNNFHHFWRQNSNKTFFWQFVNRSKKKLQTKSASKGLQFWNIRILNVRIYKGL